MDLNTASAVVTFAESLEVESAKLYEAAGKRFDEFAKVFESFIKENKKNVQAVKRAYYSVISDALETGFSFEGLSADPYLIGSELDAGTGPAEVLEQALANEAKIQGFYQQAAACSEAFMADVPRVFKRLAKNRDKRKSQLQQLLADKTNS